MQRKTTLNTFYSHSERYNVLLLRAFLCNQQLLFCKAFNQLVFFKDSHTHTAPTVIHPIIETSTDMRTHTPPQFCD